MSAQPIRNFKPGTKVRFTTVNGNRTFEGEFVRKFSPAPRAGMHYEIKVPGQGTATVFAQGVKIEKVA